MTWTQKCKQWNNSQVHLAEIHSFPCIKSRLKHVRMVYDEIFYFAQWLITYLYFGFVLYLRQLNWSVYVVFKFACDLQQGHIRSVLLSMCNCYSKSSVTTAFELSRVVVIDRKVITHLNLLIIRVHNVQDYYHDMISTYIISTSIARYSKDRSKT